MSGYDANGSPIEMVTCQKCREVVEIDATTYMETWEALEAGYYCVACERQERRDRRLAMGD